MAKTKILICLLRNNDFAILCCKMLSIDKKILRTPLHLVICPVNGGGPHVLNNFPSFFPYQMCRLLDSVTAGLPCPLPAPKLLALWGVTSFRCPGSAVLKMMGSCPLLPFLPLRKVLSMITLPVTQSVNLGEHCVTDQTYLHSQVMLQAV